MSALAEIKLRAMNLLARREHSCSELRTKLKMRGFDLALIETALQALTQEGLQSDQRFVEAYIRMRSNKGYGPLRIYAELRERGISEEILDQYLDVQDSIWLDNIETVHRKKFGSKPGKDFQIRAKQARFLQYRGFTMEQIQSVCKLA